MWADITAEKGFLQYSELPGIVYNILLITRIHDGRQVFVRSRSNNITLEVCNYEDLLLLLLPIRSWHKR